MILLAVNGFKMYSNQISAIFINRFIINAVKEECFLVLFDAW